MVGHPLFSGPVPLQQLPFRSRRSLGYTAMQTARLDPAWQLGELVDRMAYEMTFSILAGRVSSGVRRCSIPFPSSWWQHWKMEHGPKWLTKRWPVKLYNVRITLDFTRWCTFPMATIPLPPGDFGYPVVYDTVYVDVNAPHNAAASVRVNPAEFIGFASRMDLLHAFRQTWARKSGNFPVDSPVPAWHVLRVLEKAGVSIEQLVREDVLESILRS